MELNRPQNPLLLGFITVSLLLHLLLLYLLPQRNLFTAPPPEEPVFVEVRPPQPRERELDLPVPEKETPRETPAKRLGPADQTVIKETAPRGDAPEDRAPAPVRPPPPAAKPRPTPKPSPAPKPPEPDVQRQPAKEVAPPASDPKPIEAPKPLPDLKTLMAATTTAAQSVASEWRQKYRADVEEGDAVWLDTERDLLISFFQRFRTNIYGVWNYPARSAERGEEGTCLLKITVNRDGTVDKVQLMESSGHRALDDQAIAAVHKGASYGPLPRAYKKESLNIFAFFEYTLSRKIVY